MSGAPASTEAFVIGRTLGTGTFGRVRLVTEKTSERLFALRWQKQGEIVRLKQVEHIKAECQLLLSLCHPFIVKTFATWDEPGLLLLLMEYLPGGELFSYLRRRGRLPNEHAGFYAAHVVSVFEYLHGNGIIYRDLKPENMLLTATGYMKLVDFGFAKLSDKTWTLCGTPEYLAPEVITNKGHSYGVDWWALGIFIYEMLVGHPPFYDESPFGIYQKILVGAIEYPSFVDSAAVALIRGLLTADTSRRHTLLATREAEWFADLSWPDLMAQTTPAPFVPKLSSPSDTSNFDSYADSNPNTPTETFSMFDDWSSQMTRVVFSPWEELAQETRDRCRELHVARGARQKMVIMAGTSSLVLLLAIWTARSVRG